MFESRFQTGNMLKKIVRRLLNAGLPKGRAPALPHTLRSVATASP